MRTGCSFNGRDDSGDERAFFFFGLLVDQRGIIGSVSHPLPAQAISFLDDSRITVAHIGVERDRAFEAVALHDFHHPPDSHAHAVVAPRIIQDIRNQARGGLRDRCGWPVK
jgi:hypothetical protein